MFKLLIIDYALYESDFSSIRIFKLEKLSLAMMLKSLLVDVVLSVSANFSYSIHCTCCM